MSHVTDDAVESTTAGPGAGAETAPTDVAVVGLEESAGASDAGAAGGSGADPAERGKQLEGEGDSAAA